MHERYRQTTDRFAIANTKGVVSVSTCRSRDSVETYFRNVSVSSMQSHALTSRLHATSRYFSTSCPLIAEVNRSESSPDSSKTLALYKSFTYLLILIKVVQNF